MSHCVDRLLADRLGWNTLAVPLSFAFGLVSTEGERNSQDHAT